MPPPPIKSPPTVELQYAGSAAVAITVGGETAVVSRDVAGQIGAKLISFALGDARQDDRPRWAAPPPPAPEGAKP